jgi:uncharacterized membrane protein
MLMALWTVLAQYGGGGNGSGGSGGGYGTGGGYSAGYWIVVGIIAAVVIAAVVWGIMRIRARRRTGTAARSEPHRTDRAA